MILSEELFNKAGEVVKEIITPEKIGYDDLKEKLEKSADGITDKEERREFYRHMNILFLNVLVNRLHEVGKNKENRVVQARIITDELFYHYYVQSL
jgi:hypothetical protein